MATILIPNFIIPENTPKIQGTDHHATERQTKKGEHSCLENKSMFFHYFGRTLISRYNSSDPPIPRESFTSKSESNKDIEDSGVDKVNYSFTQMSFMHQSRVGTAVDRIDKEACDINSAHNERTNDSTLTSSEKFSSSSVKRLVQEKHECSLELSNFSKDRLNQINVQSQEKDNQKLNQYNHGLISDNDPISQKCDETFMIEANNFKFNSEFYSEAKVTGTASKNVDSSTEPSKEQSMFEITAVGLKLKGNFQSNFLTNEFKLLKTFNSDTKDVESSETISNIDEILMHCAISNKANHKNNKQGNSDENKPQTNCQFEKGNVSQNNETQSSIAEVLDANKTQSPITEVLDANETQSSITEVFDAKKKDKHRSSKLSDILRRSAMSLSKTLSSSFMNEKSVHSLSHANGKNVRSSSIDIKVNVSQNNETTTSDNAECDTLRIYGSSVDFTVSADKGLHLTASNYGRYDYGKASPFAGDITSDTASTHKPINLTANYENQANATSTLNIQSEGSQVDIIKAANVNTVKDARYSNYMNMSPKRNSLEMTLSNERLRLRRLDNLITSTSFRAHGMTLSKSNVTRFISPRQEFQHYRSTIQTSKALSTPTLPSQSYGAALTNKSTWERNMHSGIAVHLKHSSLSAGNYRSNLPSANMFGNHIGSRAQYTPYQSTRTSNKQYNNSTYHTLPVIKYVNHKNTNKNHINVLPGKEKECSFKSNCKKCNSNSNKQMSQSQSLNPTKYPSVFSIYNNSLNDTCITKTEYKTAMIVKKSGKSNINGSKSGSSLYSGLNFSKETRRIWPETLLTKNLATKSSNCPGNVSPYKPCIPLYAKKNEIFYNLAREIFKKKQPQNLTSTNTDSRKASLSATTLKKQSEYKSDLEFTSLRGASGRSSGSQDDQGNSKKQLTSSVEKRKSNSGQFLGAH